MVKKIKNKRPVLSNTPTKTEQTVTQIKTFTGQAFTGPIPPPSALKEYDSVLPGLAERIVSMAEAEAKHRHSMDDEMARQNELIIKREFAERRIGQIFGLCIGALSLVATIISIFLGAENVAMVIGGSTVVGLVTVFVFGRIKKDTPLTTQSSENNN